MSVLETPRIYFRGQVAWDPITTNNYDTYYDEADAETIFPAAVKKVQAFRQEAIGAVSQGSWNPHGTHRSRFFDSAVSGTDLGGRYDAKKDPFVGSPATFVGMLVDLEPYGAYSSQLFFDGISFGIDGGCRIAAKRNTRFTARYINFARNQQGAIAGIASVVWQTTFAKTDGLRIDAFDSQALQALQESLEADDVLGLTVRFNAYRTIYYDTPVPKNGMFGPVSTELTNKLNLGGWQPNPARSMMVGVIGLWRKGEPIHEPGDRALVTGPDDPPRAPTVGSVQARFTHDSITLDLSNSISETDLELTKKNFGELSVVAIDPSTNNPVTLCSFDYPQYNKDAYERTSGIITLPVDPAAVTMASSANLQLRDSSNKVLLAEAQYRALPQVPNLYMNQGDTRTATLQVYDRGVPAGAGVAVTVCVMSADGGTVESSFPLTTAADGTVSFPITGTNGSITSYVPLPGPDQTQPSQGIDTQTNTYLYVRVLPADEEIAQLPATWPNVYSRVLANWHAMAPCMDNWLDLGNEAQVLSFAPLLFKLTDQAAFENFLYMPVTRDLTPGARTLLYNFLNNPPEPAEGLEAMQVSADEAVPEKPNYARLSRKMRR
jgi:hypothetical protein